MRKIDSFHRTKQGYLLFGIIELLVADAFFGLAIDHGNLWWYLLTLIFLIGALQNFIKLIGALFHVGRSKR